MLDLIYRILWAVMLITNLVTTYLALVKNKYNKTFLYTSVFVWFQGVIFMLRYAIMGVI